MKKINIISYDDESVVAEIVNDDGTSTPLNEVIGDIDDDRDALIAVWDEASDYLPESTGERIMIAWRTLRAFHRKVPTLSDIADIMNVSRARVSTVVSGLVATGKMRKDDDGRYIVIDS